MYGIDTMLSDEMCRQLTNDLGNKAILSIRKKLFYKYAITLKQSIHEFEKLDDILESIYGKSSKKIEKRCFENICTIHYYDMKKNNCKYVEFAENSISKNIFDIFSNVDTRCIIKQFEKPNTVKNVLKNCCIKKTFGYKIIHELIKSGFITTYDQNDTDNKYNVTYMSVFSKVDLIITSKKKVKVNAKFEDKLFVNSMIPKIMSR